MSWLTNSFSLMEVCVGKELSSNIHQLTIVSQLINWLVAAVSNRGPAEWTIIAIWIVASSKISSEIKSLVQSSQPWKTPLWKTRAFSAFYNRAWDSQSLWNSETSSKLTKQRRLIFRTRPTRTVRMFHQWQGINKTRFPHPPIWYSIAQRPFSCQS